MITRIGSFVQRYFNIIRDVLISMVPQIVGVVTGFISSILIARGMGPEGFGRYALVMSISETLTVLSDLGINQTAIRYASKNAIPGNEERYYAILRWSFRVRIILIAFLCVIVLLFSKTIAVSFWHDPYLNDPIKLNIFLSIFIVLSSVPLIYFQSQKRFFMNSAIQTVQKIVYFSGIMVIALLDQWNLYSVLVSAIVSNAVGSLLFLFFIPKKSLFLKGDSFTLRSFFSLPEVNVEHDKSDNMKSFALFMFISTIVVLLTTKVDYWLIGNLLDSKQVGLYSAAMRFTLPLIIVLGSINVVLWPKTSMVKSDSEVLKILRSVIKISVSIGSLGLLYSILVPMLSPLLFGMEYSNIVFLGQLLCVRYTLAIMMSPVGVIGYSLGFVRYYWIINIIQFFVIIIIDLSLLPEYGIIIAAVSLIINELIGLIGLPVLFFLKKKEIILPPA